MPSANDILQFIMKGTYLGQDVVNVYFYKLSGTSTGALLPELWLDDWILDWNANVGGRLSVELVFDQMVINNLTDTLEFYEEPIDAGGQTGGEEMPSSVALAVKLNRSNRITRNGSKRFCGVLEAKTDGNDHTYTPAEIDLLEEFLGSPWELTDYDGAGGYVGLIPVIVGRTLSSGGVYELDITKVNTVTSALVRPTLSTQNTRKP